MEWAVVELFGFAAGFLAGFGFGFAAIVAVVAGVVAVVALVVARCEEEPQAAMTSPTARAASDPAPLRRSFLILLRRTPQRMITSRLPLAGGTKYSRSCALR